MEQQANRQEMPKREINENATLEQPQAFNNGFFAMLDRLRLIQRWSLMRCLSQENVCEHSLQVALICQALYYIRKMNLVNPTEPDCQLDLGELLAKALLHDVTEVITGDLPTPVKYFNPEIKESYRVVEDLAVDCLLAMLPNSELRSAYLPLLKNNATSKQATKSEKLCQLFIKAADKISALIKCRQEVSLGNQEFMQAATKTAERIEALNLAEANYFVKMFVPAYELSLDQLNRHSLDSVSEESEILKNEFTLE